LLDAGEADLARLVYTAFSDRCLANALTDCRALTDAAYVRLRAAGRLNMTDRPFAPPQLW
jgi:hypothetical protein